MAAIAPGEHCETRDLVERIAGGQLGARLQSEVRGWHPSLTPTEVEDAFQQACLVAATRCNGRTQGEVYVWLRTTTHRELIRVERRGRFEVLAGPRGPSVEDLAEASNALEDEVLERESQAELHELASSVLDDLSERQRQIAALYSSGSRRPQIAQHLGLTPRTVKRQLEQIFAIGRDRLMEAAGPGCEEGEELVARFAFGLASPREVGRAQLHLAGCRECGVLFERLDLWRENVAVVVPLPVAAQVHPGIVERVMDRGAEAVATFKDHLASAASHLKQHASATYYRAMDPTPLAGARPGTAVGVIASCLALGGGAATYCVSHGITPLPSLGQDHVAKQVGQRAPDAQKVQTQLPAPPIVAQPTPPPTTSTQVASPPAPEPAPPATPDEEFEPQDPVAATASSSSASVPTPSTPAPAPTSGPTEFGGP